MVDFPAPDRPVNQTTPGRWPLIATRASLVTSSACQWMLSDRRSAKSIMPAPTVALVSRSMSTNPPVSRFAWYGSNGSRRSVAMFATAISLTASVVAGVRSRVFTLMPCLMCVTVQVAVELPSFIRYGRPGSSGSLCIQTRWASNWSASPAGSAAAAIMSPRLMSISRSRVRVTDCPASADGRSPSQVTIRSTRAVAPGREHPHLVARAHRPAGDDAGVAAEVEVGPGDRLHRQAGTGR